jgi:hypothetical protein
MIMCRIIVIRKIFTIMIVSTMTLGVLTLRIKLVTVD